MKIDLHVHSKERSPCGKASEVEQIQAASAAGLHAMAFTDHHLLIQTDHLIELNRQFAPFKIFGGIEVSTGGEDILVFGVHAPDLERTDWNYRELHTYVRACLGYMVLAHPFRYHTDIQIPIEEYPPDAIEISSNNTPPESKETICSLAARLRIQVLSNSDGHSKEVIGKYYNILKNGVQDEQGLLRQLRRGEISLYP